MALKAVHVSDVPNPVEKIPEDVASIMVSPPSNSIRFVQDKTGAQNESAKLLVIGHRGSGMNMVRQWNNDDSGDGSSTLLKMKTCMRERENTIISFNAAARFPIDFVEFDVQVTRDDCPVIFHDNLILSKNQGEVIERRVTDLSLDEFLSYGAPEEAEKVGKPLLRKTKDGSVLEWKVDKDAPLCTLQGVFEKVDSAVGFNIELKFDDQIAYTEEELSHVLHVILQVVKDHAKDRPIFFSSFQPDAAILISKLQKTYPVFFLTNGGTEVYKDVRRNSLEEAINVCLGGGLQGIVSKVDAIFRNPSAIDRIRESNLSLMTYGLLNNFPEAVSVQHLMGVEGVIVDLVQEITEAVARISGPRSATAGDEEMKLLREGEAEAQFSQRQLSCLLGLVSGFMRS